MIPATVTVSPAANPCAVEVVYVTAEPEPLTLLTILLADVVGVISAVNVVAEGILSIFTDVTEYASPFE